MMKVDWDGVFEGERPEDMPELPPPEVKEDLSPYKEFQIRPEPQNR